MPEDRIHTLEDLLHLRDAPIELQPAGGNRLETLEVQRQQSDVLWSLDLDDDTIDALITVIEAIDLLNSYYFVEFNHLNPQREITTHGMQIAHARATGAVVYGITGVLYGMVADQEAVFYALFGPQIGELLMAHGKSEQQPLNRILNWLDQVRDQPTLQRKIDAEVNAMADKQVALAARLGLSEDIAQTITNSLFTNRAAGVPVDLEALSHALTSTGSDVVRENIAEGRKAIASNNYISPDALKKMDDVKKAKFLEAIQAAKDKDRAAHGARAKYNKPPEK